MFKSKTRDERKEKEEKYQEAFHNNRIATGIIISKIKTTTDKALNKLEKST